MPASITSWGRVLHPPQQVFKPQWRSDLAGLLAAPGLKLAYGLGRSYGDSCLNADGQLIQTTALNRLITADWQTGLITAEAGLSLGELLEIAIPRGWMLPVTPGTKYVTLGGALANDVHGKNHHVAGTFGCHVPAFALMRSDGQTYHCTPTENFDLYAATIGGLGLTGFISTLSLQLQRAGSMVEQETLPFQGLDEFFAIAADSDHRYEYTVAWLDTTARGRQLGRGVYFRGHSLPPEAEPRVHSQPRLGVPFALPAWTLNRYSVQAFNQLYFAAAKRHGAQPRQVHYDPFFYPLDLVHGWNKIYGPKGFYQHQCVIPHGQERSLEKMLALVAEAGAASFLAVLKVFGNRASPGLLSFPQPGYTLALDFKNQGAPTLALLRQLDALVHISGGRLYPAKDGHGDGPSFRERYPRWSELEAWRDPSFSSSFWRRMVGT